MASIEKNATPGKTVQKARKSITSNKRIYYSAQIKNSSKILVPCDANGSSFRVLCKDEVLHMEDNDVRDINCKYLTVSITPLELELAHIEAVLQRENRNGDMLRAKKTSSSDTPNSSQVAKPSQQNALCRLDEGLDNTAGHPNNTTGHPNNTTGHPNNTVNLNTTKIIVGKKNEVNVIQENLPLNHSLNKCSADSPNVCSSTRLDHPYCCYDNGTTICEDEHRLADYESKKVKKATSTSCIRDIGSTNQTAGRSRRRRKRNCVILTKTKRKCYYCKKGGHLKRKKGGYCCIEHQACDTFPDVTNQQCLGNVKRDAYKVASNVLSATVDEQLFGSGAREREVDKEDQQMNNLKPCVSGQIDAMSGQIDAMSGHEVQEETISNTSERNLGKDNKPRMLGRPKGRPRKRKKRPCMGWTRMKMKNVTTTGGKQQIDNLKPCVSGQIDGQEVQEETISDTSEGFGILGKNNKPHSHSEQIGIHKPNSDEYCGSDIAKESNANKAICKSIHCDKGFKKRKSCVSDKMSRKQTGYKCNHCNEILFSQQKLSAHLLICTEKSTHLDGAELEDNASTDSNIQFREQASEFNVPVKRFTCKVCKTSYRRPGFLMMHLRTHKYIGKDSLYYKDLIESRCDLDLYFAQNFNLTISKRQKLSPNKHQQNTSRSSKNATNTFYECDVCKAQFDNSKWFKWHMEGHEERFGKAYKVSCTPIHSHEKEVGNSSKKVVSNNSSTPAPKNDKYNNKSNDGKLESKTASKCGNKKPEPGMQKVDQLVENAVSVQDLVKQPFKCSICLRGFVYFKCFSTHMKLHRPEQHEDKASCQRTELSEISEACKKNDSFKCSECDKEFPHLDNLENHKSKFHYHKCHQCGVHYCSAEKLTNHKLMHISTEKICKVCGKHFFTTGELITHYRTHKKRKLQSTLLQERKSITLKDMLKLTSSKSNNKRHDVTVESLQEGSHEKVPDVSIESLQQGSHEKVPDVPIESLQQGSHEKVPDVPIESLHGESHEKVPDVPIESLKGGYHEKVPDVPIESLQQGFHEKVPDVPIKSLQEESDVKEPDMPIESLQGESNVKEPDVPIESLQEGSCEKDVECLHNKQATSYVNGSIMPSVLDKIVVYPCSVCDKVFHTLWVRTAHIRRRHSNKLKSKNRFNNMEKKENTSISHGGTGTTSTGTTSSGTTSTGTTSTGTTSTGTTSTGSTSTGTTSTGTTSTGTTSTGTTSTGTTSTGTTSTGSTSTGTTSTGTTSTGTTSTGTTSTGSKDTTSMGKMGTTSRDTTSTGTTSMGKMGMTRPAGTRPARARPARPARARPARARPARAHDQHGHDQHGHDQHGHDQHGHDQHGHDQHGHDQHGHDQHGHDQHGHDQHGHDQHGHDQHGHDQHGHDQHGHDQHGHDQHGHDQHGHNHGRHGHGRHWLDQHGYDKEEYV